MTRKRWILTVAVALGLTVLALSFADAYHVEDGVTGDLLWNETDAYLFLETGSIGWRFAYLEYPVELIKVFLGGSVGADGRTSSVVVLQIDPDSVKRYGPQPLSLSSVTPIHEGIYARSDQGLMKWSGVRFERASATEEQYFGSSDTLEPDFTSIAGWSKRCCLMSRAPEAKFAIQLGGKPMAVIVRQGENDDSISVNLEREGQASERIWYLDQRPRKINQSEYGRVFGGH